MKELKKRLDAPTPPVIVKLQKLAAMVGGLGTVVSSVMMLFPQMQLPNWVPFTILAGTVLNHLLLSLFTNDDNE